MHHNISRLLCWMNERYTRMSKFSPPQNRALIKQEHNGFYLLKTSNYLKPQSMWDLPFILDYINNGFVAWEPVKWPCSVKPLLTYMVHVCVCCFYLFIFFYNFKYYTLKIVFSVTRYLNPKHLSTILLKISLKWLYLREIVLRLNL